jgi:TetR/AcrR family transcriptional repressor of nem operon
MSKVKLFDKAKALEVVAEIFRKKGYNATSIDELMTATGVTRSKLYRLFNDKHSLYVQSLAFSKNPDYRAFEDKIIRRGFQKVETLFKEVINYLISGQDEKYSLSADTSYEMIRECCSISQVVCNNKEEVENMFVNWLSEDQNKTTINFSNSLKVYSQFLYNALCGLRIMSQSGASKAELNNVVKITLGSLN